MLVLMDAWHLNPFPWFARRKDSDRRLGWHSVARKLLKSGAGDGIRTHGVQLGNLATKQTLGPGSYTIGWLLNVALRPALGPRGGVDRRVEHGVRKLNFGSSSCGAKAPKTCHRRL